MKLRTKTNCLQKNRVSQLTNFTDLVISTLSRLSAKPNAIPSFQKVLTIFAENRFGMVHSFCSKNESSREFYELFFEILFGRLKEGKASIKYLVVCVVYLCLETAPAHFGLIVHIDLKRVRTLSLFQESVGLQNLHDGNSGSDILIGSLQIGFCIYIFLSL